MDILISRGNGEIERLEWNPEEDVVVVSTRAGSVMVHGYIDEETMEEGETHVSFYDHLTFRIRGHHKDNPLIIVEGDEYETQLEVRPHKMLELKESEFFDEGEL